MKINGKVEKYLKERFGSETKLKDMERLGEGVHGAAYLLRFSTLHEEQHLIMKTLFPSRFGHDHYSDRAQVLLLANANYNDMPKHIKAVDVVGESPDRFISVKDAKEFYIFMEKARGEPADDVSCLSINYIHYAIKDRGTFEGPFAEPFRLFLEYYLEKTNDDGFFEVTMQVSSDKLTPCESARKIMEYVRSRWTE